MATTGQTISDRLNAVRYALVGQGLARTVCKATTEEVLGPKKKHIDYLIACTNEPNVSIPQIANLLIERTQHASWTVVFKSLISIHHLMSYGNERFTQYLATSNHSFELADFMDRTTPQGYNMSTFVRRYAKYINDKSISYRTLALDLCKIRSGNDNALRTVNMDKLSKMLPIVQAQFDSLLEFGATSKDLNNGIIMSAFRLLYKDLVKLYVAYQEAIINLLERYFKLSRKKAREALELYKKYLARMDKIAEFLSIVDSVGLDKSEMPDLTKSPASILKLLEQHLAQLEAKKRGTTPASPEAEDEGDNKDNEGVEEKATESSSEPKDGKGEGATKEEDQSSSEVPPVGVTAQTPERKEPPPEKHQPPQKPARPSPKASPEVSPPAPKPAPTPSVSATPPHPPPPTHHAQQNLATEQKKAQPPERPAKPPSRPPPPASIVQAPVSSPVGEIEPDQASQSGNQQSKTRVSEANSPTFSQQTNPPPPPHPPALASSSVPTASPKREASEVNTNGSSSVEETHTSCAASVSNTEDIGGSSTSATIETTNHLPDSSVINGSEQAESNHVSQVEVEQEPEDLVMPPPPPPIEDLEEADVIDQPPVGEPQELVVNGQSDGPPNGGVE